MRKTGFIVVSLLLVTSLIAQQNHRFLLGFEFSGATVSGQLSENWSVRQDISPYSGYSMYTSSVNNVSSIAYFGIKPELTFNRNRLSVDSGVRFTQLDSYLSGGINDEYFFLRYKSDASATEYARVKTLSETVHYLSIPLELKYVPIQISNVGIYGKIGTEAGIKLNSKKAIEFISESMKPYGEEILNTNQVNPNNMYSTFYGAIGVRWESLRGTHVNLEWLLPSRFLTQNNLTQITPGKFSGFQLSVLFPFHKKK